MVEEQAEGGGQHHHRDDEGQPDRQVVVLDQQGEDEGRREGLGGEAEVEDAGRLVGENEADREERVRAPVGDAWDGEPEELLHAGARPAASGPGRGQAPGVPGGGVASFGILVGDGLKQTKTCLPWPRTGTNLFPCTWM